MIRGSERAHNLHLNITYEILSRIELHFTDYRLRIKKLEFDQSDNFNFNLFCFN